MVCICKQGSVFWRAVALVKQSHGTLLRFEGCQASTVCIISDSWTIKWVNLRACIVVKVGEYRLLFDESRYIRTSEHLQLLKRQEFLQQRDINSSKYGGVVGGGISGKRFKIFASGSRLFGSLKCGDRRSEADQMGRIGAHKVGNIQRK